MFCKIPTKNKLINSLIIESLFIRPDTISENILKSLPIWRYDKGKYQNKVYNNEIDKINKPIFYQIKKDENGNKYYALYCFNEYAFNDIQSKEFDKIYKVWNTIKDKF